MPALRLYLLGTLRIQYDDRPLPQPPTLKSQSLLAYLVCHRDRPQPRDRLVHLFWGDRPERNARRSLNTALWHIRHRCLPHADLILSDARMVQFDPEADLWLDVEAFEALASRDDLESLQAAVALYRGDFLEGFYDDWVINERYRLEALLFEVLERLMVGYEAREEHEAALATALHLLNRDPLREEAHRAAMRAYCRLGRRNAALEQYRRCQRIVQAELGTEPMVETTELYRAILEGRIEIGRVSGVRASLVEMLPETPPPSGRTPLDVTAASPLVGREEELACLHRCWREAQAGRGRLILIGGEAGIGKSRLIQAFADHLRWQGTRVLQGRCYEFERLLPYQPFVEVLRTALPTLTSIAMSNLPAWVLGEVARLVPEVLEQPAQRVSSTIRSDQERGHLFDGVARFLSTLATHGPLLIVLEDLHWATETTLQLLHYLARRLAGHPVLLVGSYRIGEVEPQHPFHGLREQLHRQGLAVSLRLPPLSVAAVEDMVARMSGAGAAAVPLARRLHHKTEGNPLFIIEIVKELFEVGTLRLVQGRWQGDFDRLSEADLPLPAGVRQVIQGRVRRLDEDSRMALQQAAVIGQEFDLELLNALRDEDEGATLEAIDALLRHRLIVEGAGAMGRDYAFSHHLIQEAVYAGIPQRRRQYVHARVGMAMERLYGPQIEELAGELAFHFQQGRLLDESLTEKAIAYLLQAGDRARGLYAHREAIHFYQQALALLNEQGEYERAARTLMKLGLTYHNAFDFKRARQAYDEGFALWQRAGAVRPAAPHALRVLWSDPLTLDPTMADDVVSVSVIDQLFSGLVELSPETDVIPDVARTWEVLEDGQKYVFHLRDDVRWSDGSPVTAADFEYAWKRLLDPAIRSPIARWLFGIKGASAFHRGEAGREDVGVRAIDEVTLVVELEGPTSYFPHLLASSAAYPVPRHVVETHGASWTKVENIVTNGPFRLEAWNRDEYIFLSRNPGYHGRFEGNAQQVELFLIQDPYAQLEIYQADGLDVVDLWALPASEMDRARQRHATEYISVPVPRTHYVGFNVSRPPFDDLRVRRAFVLATDRESLAGMAMRGRRFPATGGFVPPGVPGHSSGIGLPYDPGLARQLLAEAGYPGGRGLPAVESLTGDDDAVREYLGAQWRENLGAEIKWETAEYGVLRDRVDREPPHMFILSWGAAYPDPDFFLRVSPARRDSRWRSETYDGLVEQARRVTDQKERMRLYRQADRILVEEAVIMPLTYGRMHLLVKPWVRKFPTSAIRQWFWKDVIIEPH
ncbi:MAG: AAA family ATPase [Chloroflexi bacterium]|nr:AAA family ATPase [Chloroflexota bacterium]